ncbi:hypothetical protein EYF80_048278 [Liparis tanakae]|uniref:Uncharacterized protein n=1 Tax=Liparis tanakae TaxID=230148 RepID=A0A4Z2FLA4_9TELE|nr:hypothetical protein EYF80_048278 [Liparis tanakae]
MALGGLPVRLVPMHTDGETVVSATGTGELVEPRGGTGCAAAVNQPLRESPGRASSVGAVIETNKEAVNKNASRFTDQKLSQRKVRNTSTHCGNAAAAASRGLKRLLDRKTPPAAARRRRLQRDAVGCVWCFCRVTTIRRSPSGGPDLVSVGTRDARCICI